MNWVSSEFRIGWVCSHWNLNFLQSNVFLQFLKYLSMYILDPLSVGSSWYFIFKSGLCIKTLESASSSHNYLQLINFQVHSSCFKVTSKTWCLLGQYQTVLAKSIWKSLKNRQASNYFHIGKHWCWITQVI